MLIFCLAAALFAFAKGGAAERLAAGVIAADFLAATANYALTRSQLLDLGIDAAAGLGLLVIALRYTRPWLGAVMIAYALQFGLDAYYLVTERPMDQLHALLNNSVSFAINILLALGAEHAWRRRARQQAAP